MPPRAGLACACGAAAFAALARALAFWTGGFAEGAALALACAAAGLLAAALLPPPSQDAAPWWRVAAGCAGPACAAWLRFAGLNAADPALLLPAASAPLGAPLAAGVLLFLLLGRAARGAKASAMDLVGAPLGLGAAGLLLERADPALALALSTPAWLLSAPPAAAAGGLALAAALGSSARTALRDATELRLIHLFAGWRWVSEPAGAEGLGAVLFPDGRLATLRAGRASFEDPRSADAALLAVLGQRIPASGSVLLLRPRGAPLAAAARKAGLSPAVADDAGGAAALDAAVSALDPDAAKDATSAVPPPGPHGLLLVRVPGRGGRAEREGLATRRALQAWRRFLEPDAAAGLWLPGGAAPADVESARADAAAVFGHAAALDLEAAVLIVASPQPLLTDPLALSQNLPAAARSVWRLDELPPQRAWRSDGAGK